MLNGWKMIAAHIGRDQRTAMRWAAERGLPVHRTPGRGRGSVYALPDEIDAWLAADRVRPAPTPPSPPADDSTPRRLGGPHRRAVIAGGLTTVAAAALLLRRRDGGRIHRQMLADGLDALRMGTADSTAQAVGFLQRAIAEAPTDPTAWGALALAYHGSEHFLDGTAAGDARTRADAAARRALDLDPTNIEARAATAVAIMPFGRWAASEQACRAVLASDPAQFEAGLWLSYTLAAVGRTRDALAALEPLAETSSLRPLYQYWRAYLLWSVQRTDEADATIDRAMGLWPRNYQVWFTRFWLYAHGGRAAAALIMSADQARRPAGIPDWNFALIDASARAIGSRAAVDVDRALALNLDAARRGAGFAENAVEFAASVGRADAAFVIADAYFFGDGFRVGTTRYTVEQGSYTRPGERQTRFLFTPPTRTLRGDARFARLTRRIGLDDYWRRSGTKPDPA